MLKYQDGDHMAFEVLYSRHKDKIYGYLAKRLHDGDELDDLFQKVLVKFHRSRELYHEKYDVLPWLYTITKSEYLDFLKKRRIEKVEFKETMHSSVIENEDSLIDIANEKQLSDKERLS